MLEVVNFLLDPANRLFTGAVVILLVLITLEVLTMIVGASLSALLDGWTNFSDTFDLSFNKPEFDFSKPELSVSKPDLDKPDISFHGFMGWINAGHVPLLILIIAFLGGFAVTGLSIQWLMHGVFHFTLPTLVVGPIATVLTLPIVRSVSTTVGRLFPQDNTNAITVDKLIGHYGKMVIGPASKERPGQVKVRDDHGTAHYVRAIPENESTNIEQGADVVLLERLDSDTFLVREA